MPWELTGNSDATTTSFLGSTNAQPLIVRTGTTPAAQPPERLRITPDGRIGIGTATPHARLSIAGAGAIINNVTVGTDGVNLNYPNEKETIGLANPGTGGVLRLQSPNGLTFHTGAPGTTPEANEKARITTDGNVGVGTATPQARAHVSSAEPQLRIDGTGNRTLVQLSKGEVPQWDFGVGTGAAGNNDFWFGDFTAYRMVLQKATGNVGIGTLDPRRRLQIGGDIAGLGLEPSDASPNAGYVRFGDNTGWKLHFGRSRESSSGPTLNTGTTGTLMTIQDNGNVGIGVTAPAARLHVEGGNVRWGNKSVLSTDQGGSIELGGDNSTAGAGTPYIDFHHRGLAQDFNTRIINDENGRLSIVASTLGLTGNIRFPDGSVQTTAYRLLIQSGEVGTQGLSAPKGHTDRPVWVQFPTPFSSPPAVVVSIKALDVDHSHNLRVDVWVGNTTQSGFEAVFRTWADTHIYLVGASWMAYGSR